MKKRIESICRAKVIYALVVSLAILFAAQTQVVAQHKIKAGDRIGEVSIRDGSVRKGKVIELSTRTDIKGCYVVQWDNRSYGEQTCASEGLTKLVALDRNDEPVIEDEKPAEEEGNNKPANATLKGDNKNRNAAGFQPGDRIEHQRGHDWYKGTVVANEVKSNSSYVIKYDEDPSVELRVAASQVRALTNPKGDDGGRKAAAEAEKGAAQAATLCSGEPVVNPRTKGRAPSAALFREVIRASFDRAAGNYNYKQVTTINDLRVGKPYKEVAITIYPVKASYTTCEDAKSAWRMSDSVNYEYICYVDPARDGEWTCGIYKRGTGENLIVQKPEANKLIKPKGNKH